MTEAGFVAYRGKDGGIRFERKVKQKGELDMPAELARGLRAIQDLILACSDGNIDAVPEADRKGCWCPACGDWVTFRGFWDGFPSGVCGRTVDVKACPYRCGCVRNDQPGDDS